MILDNCYPERITRAFVFFGTSRLCVCIIIIVKLSTNTVGNCTKLVFEQFLVYTCTLKDPHSYYKSGY